MSYELDRLRERCAAQGVEVLAAVQVRVLPEVRQVRPRRVRSTTRWPAPAVRALTGLVGGLELVAQVVLFIPAARAGGWEQEQHVRLSGPAEGTLAAELARALTRRTPPLRTLVQQWLVVTPGALVLAVHEQSHHGTETFFHVELLWACPLDVVPRVRFLRTVSLTFADGSQLRWWSLLRRSARLRWAVPDRGSEPVLLDAPTWPLDGPRSSGRPWSDADLLDRLGTGYGEPVAIGRWIGRSGGCRVVGAPPLGSAARRIGLAGTSTALLDGRNRARWLVLTEAGQLLVVVQQLRGEGSRCTEHLVVRWAPRWVQPSELTVAGRRLRVGFTDGSTVDLRVSAAARDALVVSWLHRAQPRRDES